LETIAPRAAHQTETEGHKDQLGALGTGRTGERAPACPNGRDPATSAYAGRPSTRARCTVSAPAPGRARFQLGPTPRGRPPGSSRSYPVKDNSAGLLFGFLCDRVLLLHRVGLRGGAAESKARNRCCFVREFDRKPDPSRFSVRVFGPFLPFVLSFSRPRQCHYLKGGTPWVRRFMSVGCRIRRPSRS